MRYIKRWLRQLRFHCRLEDISVLLVLGWCRYFKSVSVFRYTGLYSFKSVRYFLSVFQNIAISVRYFRYFTLRQSRHVRILKFCFGVGPRILTEYIRVRVAATRTSANLSDLPWQRVGVNLAHWMRRTQKNSALKYKLTYLIAHCFLRTRRPLQRHSKH